MLDPEQKRGAPKTPGCENQKELHLRKLELQEKKILLLQGSLTDSLELENSTKTPDGKVCRT